MSARAAIWIVSEPRPEHVAAIAWLNESSSADFYLVKVEAVKIQNSPAAPLLTVIVGPSAETKSVGLQKKELAERFDIRRSWWEQLVSLPEEKLHAHLTPGQYSWIGTSTGIRGLNLNYVVWQDGSAAELYIDRGKDSEQENKSIFDAIAENKSTIDEKIKESTGILPSWERLDSKRASRIRISLEGGYRDPTESWPAIQRKMVEAMNALDFTLKPYLRKLKVN